MTLDELRSRNFATVAEVAETFFGGQVDERTVRRAIADGQIQAVKVGAKTLVPVAPLLAMIDAPEQPGTAAPTPPAEPGTDALAAVREVLRGALRALDVLTGYQGEDHNGDEHAVNAGQSDASGGRPLPPPALRSVRDAP